MFSCSIGCSYDDYTELYLLFLCVGFNASLCPSFPLYMFLVAKNVEENRIKCS